VPRLPPGARVKGPEMAKRRAYTQREVLLFLGYAMLTNPSVERYRILISVCAKTNLNGTSVGTT
jgi:hypothetical protein